MTTFSHANPPKRLRDVRLDFFRGMCLIIIYIAHIWDNPWAQFIPARFGFSDATEIFVFCSGMASAVAFGSVFARRGLFIGTVRVAHRCWQVYWSHIATFLVVITLMIAADTYLHGDYLAGLGIDHTLKEHAGEMLFGLITLTFVPHYFDILPMYLAILAMLPVVMWLAIQDKRLLAMSLVVMWATAWTGRLDLPAEPWSVGTPQAQTWFFNPFAWQIVFFTGFASMRGWIAPPTVDRRMIAAAAAIVLLSVPLSWQVALDASETLTNWNALIAPLIAKTRLGVLRYVHFIALAYLAYVAVGESGNRIRGPIARLLCRVGQQSLAVFMSGLVLSFAASIILNLIGRSVLTVAVVNLGGIAILVMIAMVVAWLKSSPWNGDGSTASVKSRSTGVAPLHLERSSAAG